MTDESGHAATADVARSTLRDVAGRFAIDLTPLRAYTAFRRLWLGQSVSYIGTEIAEVAVAYQVYQLTHSTLAVGLIALTRLVPLLSLALIGGAIADAVDRGRLMLVQQIGMLAGSVGLAANAALAHPHVWPLYAFAFLTQAFFSLGVAAQRALTPQLVEKEHFLAASALNGVTSQFGAVVGPAFAGVLIEFVALKWIYVADAASYAGTLAAVVLLPRLGAPADADRPSLSSIITGFRYVRSQPVVLGFFLVDTNAMIFGMPMSLFPAIAAHRYGNASLVGYLYAAPAVGALLMSLVSGTLGHIRRQGVAVIVAASLWGIAIGAFAFAGDLWLGLLLLGAAGAADETSAILRSVMLYRITPNPLLGRVSGIEFMQVASAPSIGNLEAGALASATSVRFSIMSGGVACVVGCVLLGAAFPALLRYDARKPVQA